MTSNCLIVLTICTVIALSHFCVVTANPFKDVSTEVGLDRSKGPRRKYGGPSIADLNGDGFPDLLFAHHDDQYAEAYLNNGKGKFDQIPWNYWDDTHGFVPFRSDPYQKFMYFLLMRGGNNGKNPRPPLVYRISPDKKMQEVSAPSAATGRGRTALFLPLNPSLPGVNNVIFFNAPSLTKKEPQNIAGRALPGGAFSRLNLKGFQKETNSFAAATDVDDDGRVEFCTFENLRFYRVTSPLTVTEISKTVLPSQLQSIRGVVAVAELDFDNDGRMDLYIARTSSSDLNWLRSVIGRNPSDYLLRNVGGRYVDVTASAKIPGGGDSRGVTVGDLNNDGWVDILVSQYDTPYRLLLNNGDGTFRITNSNFARPVSAYGDAPAAVDYDRDGKLDVVLSEGDYIDRAHGGQFRVMKNIGSHPNYLLIRVGSSPGQTATSLYAVATVRIGKRSMIRRVGSSGTAISMSYIELLHFGLGSSVVADVAVRWADGSRQAKRVNANSVVTFGVV